MCIEEVRNCQESQGITLFPIFNNSVRSVFLKKIPFRTLGRANDYF